MYVTIYTKTVKRRATGQTETVGCQYQTKSLTDMHRHIRKTYPEAQTWEGPKSVITDLFPGVNLGSLPIVRGGTRVA